MRHKNTIVRLAFILVLLVVAMSAAVLPGAAHTAEEIQSAHLVINAQGVYGATVNVYRVKVDWDEGTVTGPWFYSQPDPYDSETTFGTFEASPGKISVDVTALVKLWVDGTYPNQGLLLDQLTEQQGLTGYKSSEWGTPAERPMLVIKYTDGTIDIIQRGLPDSLVEDAYIWPTLSDPSGGNAYLYTGYLSGFEKQSLIWFDIPVEPPPDGEGCTPGYWKQEQHFHSWDANVPHYDQDALFSAVFGVGPTTDSTLLEALSAKGGGEHALMRHATAGLLNAAAHPEVNYLYSTAEVIAKVKDAYLLNTKEAFNAAKDELEFQNELGCPLN